FSLNLALITPGRTGYVVFLVLTVWCFAMSRGFKGVVLGALVAAAVGGAAFVLSPSLKGRVMSGIIEAQNYSTDASETSLGRRMVMLDASVEMIRKNPLLGPRASKAGCGQRVRQGLGRQDGGHLRRDDEAFRRCLEGIQVETASSLGAKPSRSDISL
ncbi:MAG: O-antigen ligase family protein, partial [Chlorobia bacterium]|nr:O-antigen ligase family protein [Fimbriimonadaceae bacterium]